MQETQKSSVKFIIIFSIFIVTLFIQIVQWDRHFLSIIPLQLKSLTGVATADDARKLTAICTERMKYSCTENQLSYIGAIEKNNAEVMVELGEIRRKTGQLESALKAYTEHFNRGGSSNIAAYETARILEKKNELEKAKHFYLQALMAKPDVLQVTVIYAYVNLLVKSGDFKEAKAIIEDARKKKGPKADFFMARELDYIKGNINRI